ncbi:MAG: Ppx/GppA family phosphatase [Gemmatimonadota bacterium]|nr:Ppx/GppA family phosphatase [Gemmatimonadota bacterium]
MTTIKKLSGQPRLAAIDVGTNTIRLTVAEVEQDGTYRILDEEREMVRLGHDMDRTGRLAEEAVARALAAIGKMKAIAEGFEVTEVRAIATSAVREAANGRAFTREVFRQHKVRIDVISGEEEAELAFRSATRHFTLDGRSSAVVDIGGGSVEVILAAGTVIDQIHSLPLGAVRVTERLVRSDPLRKKHWKVMRREIDRGIREGIGRLPHRAEVMVGSGGTFTALAHMAKWQREGRHGSVQGYMLTPAELVHLLDRLREASLDGRRQIPGLSADRADIIVAGAAVIARLVKRLGTQQIMVNERGIRDGLLLGMIADLTGASAVDKQQVSDRMEWVRLFARKCRSNERHCEHVANLSLQIFDGMKARYQLSAAGRDVLQAASLLHDIGYLISHSKHHKHTYHLILYGDLPAFSPREVELIANVARYHRRAFPKKSHANLAGVSADDRKLIAQLSGILRVADGLDRTHSQAVSAIRTRALRNRLRLDIEADGTPEVERVEAERKSDLFRKAFDTELELAWRNPQEHGRVAGTPRPRLHVVAAG